MTFQLGTIASGSSGNCAYLQAGEERILIDVGISGKKALQGLEEMGVDPTTLKGIFITHEHGDHIKGVGILSRKLDLPIYATKETWDKLINEAMIGKIKETHQCVIEKDKPLQMGELTIIPYGIYHDAVDPVGYIFHYQDKKIVLATDLGKVDRELVSRFYGAHGMLLEFNHDVNMVEVGSYPYPLKKRILGDYGHLSNDLAAKVLAHVYHEEMKWVILGHLSNDNNLPDLAYLTAKNALAEKQIIVGEDLVVTVANRHCMTPLHQV